MPKAYKSAKVIGRSALPPVRVAEEEPRPKTVKALQRYISKLALAYGPEILIPAFEQLRNGTVKGDKELIHAALKVYGVLPTPQGSVITVNNQATAGAAANAAAKADTTNSRGFDEIVRQRAEMLRGKTVDLIATE